MGDLLYPLYKTDLKIKEMSGSIQPINVTEKQSVETYLNRLRTTPTDPLQERLTLTHIIPYLPAMVVCFEQLREGIDMAVNQFSILQYGAPLKNLHVPSIDSSHVFYSPMLQSVIDHQFEKIAPEILTNYPIGRCSEITWVAWRLLMKETFLPLTEGILRLQAFISTGGNFQVIWGGIRHAEFQTAFQAGDYYFDISNDTSRLYKPKIAHSLLEKSEFNDINSYLEYVRIKSDYHQADIFINNCFPRLFPYFPLFVRYRGKRQFAIDASMYMGRLNILTRFSTIIEAMDDGSLGERLDDNILEQIKTSVGKMTGDKSTRDILEFRVLDKNESLRLFRRYALLERAEQIVQLKRGEKICRFLNYLWAKEGRE